jgi:hypothetical protein
VQLELVQRKAEMVEVQVGACGVEEEEHILLHLVHRKVPAPMGDQEVGLVVLGPAVCR